MVDPVTTETTQLATEMDEILARWDIDAVFNQPDVACDVSFRALAIAVSNHDRGRTAWSHLPIGESLATLARLADAELLREVTRSFRFGHILSIAMVDLDRLKSVNDRYSHQVGDQVLRAVADLFSNGLRSTDIVARYGGEEFVLVFPETSLAAAAMIVEQVREMVERADWGAIRPGLTMTISAGVVSCRSWPLRSAPLGQRRRDALSGKRAGPEPGPLVRDRSGPTGRRASR